MTFEHYIDTALDAGAAFNSGKDLVREFEAYLALRYPGWAGAGRPRVVARYAEELAKAPREYEIKVGAEAARHCSRNLLGIERRYVDGLELTSLFGDGSEVYRYKVARPVIKNETWVHIFEGNASGAGGNQTHTGLHWLGRFNAGNHPSRKRLDQIVVTNTGNDPTLGMFKANVTVWSKAKASTFFPTDWTEAVIRELVTGAARFAVARGPGAGQKVRENRGLVNWAGKVLVHDADQYKPLWIGGLGDPAAATGVTTAFPEFGGSFAP